MTNVQSTSSISGEFWQALFAADSIAVIGARDVPGSWGYDALRAALDAKKIKNDRRIYAVNPGAQNVLGLRVYPAITNIPDEIDLATIVVPAAVVPAVLKQCVQKKVKAAVIITAGFAEVDDEGARLQAEIIEIAKQGGLHFVGPNCIGHADLYTRVSSIGFIGRFSTGPMALLTQSGTLGATIMQVAGAYGIGLSKIVSTGNEADLHMEDLLEFLAHDEKTRIITAYIEGLREGRRFLNLAAEITLKKPVIAIKTGSTGEAGRAARSHTGAMAGTDAVYSAAFKQAGVIRVEDEEELCDTVLAYLYAPLPRGNRVAILTMGGGFGVVTAEACEKEGLRIASLEPSTLERLNAILPPRWSHGNPVDLVGMKSSAGDTTVANCHKILLEDPNVDAVISLLPPVMPPPPPGLSYTHQEIQVFQAETRRQLNFLIEQVKKNNKPLYLIKRFSPLVETPGASIPPEMERIPEYLQHKRAARVLRHLVWYREYLDYRKSE